MKLTNRAGLHPLVYRAILAQAKAHPSMKDEPRFASVTELLSPPCQVALKRRHWADLEEEAEGRLWALFGSALHHVLATGDKDGKHGLSAIRALVEKRLSLEAWGKTITGGFDSCVLDQGWLADYKLTSVWSIVFGDRVKEWEAQANIYAEMLRCIGVDVRKITIEVFLKDWSRRELDTDRKAALQYNRPCTYPDKDWQRIELRIWPTDEVLTFVRARISALEAALEADVPVECSKEERWEKETTWAVYKGQNRNATKVFKEESKGETREDAQKYIAAIAEATALKAVKAGARAAKGRGDLEQAEEKALFAKADKVRQKTLALYHIEDRPGQRVRCADYCIAAQVCPHWKAHLESLYGRDFGPDKDEETRPVIGDDGPKDMWGATPQPASVRRTRAKGGA